MDLTGFQNEQRNKKEWTAIKREFKLGVLILGGAMAIMWGLVWADGFFDSVRFAEFGIDPRSWSGIPAIVYAHFIHQGPWHLAGNMLPFLILGGLVLLRDVRDFVAISAITMIVSGSAVWLLGNEVTRVGSGALICGYLGYMLVFGFLEKSKLSIFVSVVVGLLFFGTFLGALNPFTTGSWIGCVTALLTGGVVGRFMIRNFKSHLTNSVTDPS